MIIEVIKNVNLIIAVIFMLLYVYQYIYLLVPFFKKPAKHLKERDNRFAVLISARNEESVIVQLIESIKQQTYSQELIDIFVVADNCTDETAQRAREAGAEVYERNDENHVGKGYALDFVIEKIHKKYGSEYYDGFFVFDADNILEKTYIEAMNRSFSDGYRIITSYRNSKNYGTNWLSAGSSLWFLRESKYLNYSRMLLNTGCAISGTGFLLHKDIVNKENGWKCFLLTEDIEFSIKNTIEGERIAYCHEAVLYDEQPVKFSQSWSQRLRWARGFLQVFGNYGIKLLGSMFKTRKFACFDMSMTILPSIFITLATLVMNITGVAIGVALGEDISGIAWSLLEWVRNVYVIVFVLGLITTITEWKMIHCSAVKKILYMFTFPLFLFTYVPISIVALFKNVKWEPIEHQDTSTLNDIINS